MSSSAFCCIQRWNRPVNTLRSIADGSAAKNLSCKRNGSMFLFPLSYDDAVHARFAGIAGFDEELRLFCQPPRRVRCDFRRRVLLALEQELRELAASRFIGEQPEILEPRPEL